MTKRQDAFNRDNAVVDIIFKHRGENNIISGVEIAKQLTDMGFPTKKDCIHSIMTKIIFDRKLPILSKNSRGYFWASTQDEIQKCIDDLENRCSSILEHAEILRAYIIK